MHCACDTAPVALVVVPLGQARQPFAAGALLARYLGWYLPCGSAAAHTARSFRGAVCIMVCMCCCWRNALNNEINQFIITHLCCTSKHAKHQPGDFRHRCIRMWLACLTLGHSTLCCLDRNLPGATTAG